MARIRKFASARPTRCRRQWKAEFRHFKGDLSGKALIVAMQASPYRDIGIEPGRMPMPVRKA